LNYRHEFHAGNFADCMKHALLVWLLRALLRKPAPFAVLDTHAGAGRYDLTGAPAARSGEAVGGIVRLRDAAPAALADYLGLVEQLGLYPGSPVLTRALLRPFDRLICCELHPATATELQRCFAHDPLVGVHQRDAREAVRGLLPPGERRGLVLLDPSYEAPDEYDALVASLVAGHRRFRTGIFAAWYPIKHLAPVHALHAALQASGLRDIVAAELHLRAPVDPARLNGCGLVVINPPYGFVGAAQTLLASLHRALSDDESGGSRVLTLVAE
jgi:23S rRNA (adenine2030-N6)-methyltransferase